MNMIDSNYLSLNIPGEMELVPSSLLYTSPLDSSPPLANQLGFYDYYGDYENQNDLNNINLTDFTFTDMVNNVASTHVPPVDYYPNGGYDDGYNLTNLNNQLVESVPIQSISPTSPYQPSSTNDVNYRYSTTSSVSSASLSSSSDYVSSNQRPLSTTSIDSIDVTRSIDGCKRDLIKATLNFAIKRRRRSRGLGEIELKHVKSQEPRTLSWTDEDDEKKMSRRERNRIAARKCRKNRKLKFMGLNKTMEDLGNDNSNLREQLTKLERESSKLEHLLSSHQPQCYLVSWSSQPMLTSASSSIPSPSASSSPSPNHLSRNQNYSQSDESHGFISYINQSHWPNALQ